MFIIVVIQIMLYAYYFKHSLLRIYLWLGLLLLI